MPTRPEPYEKMTAEREASEREARRMARRHWTVTLLICLAWCVLGAAVTTFGFMIDDPENGRVLVRSGGLLAAGGVLLTVVAAAAYRKDRGLE